MRLEGHFDAVTWSAQLAQDVRIGLTRPQKMLPPKYFYDQRGSELFDAICDTPEYYLTRTEQTLLEQYADAIVATAQPSELVEFGSGTSRKTRLLLDAMQRRQRRVRYVAIDVSEATLRASARRLLDEYPQLSMHAVVGDYERHLHHLPNGAQRLVAFIGSTLGNFTAAEADVFLARVAAQLTPGEYFLLGIDLVKDPEVLHAAYNDAAGITAEFNRNILRVMNHALQGHFNPAAFDHVAFFNPEASQIEMHLRARRAHAVRVDALGMTVHLSEGETIHTEISRKFTRPDTEAMLRRAGFEPVRWFEPANRYFGLALSRRSAYAVSPLRSK